MKYLIYIFLFFIPLSEGVAQGLNPEEQKMLDSINVILNDKSSHDTSLVSAYVTLGELLYYSNPDTLIPLCEVGIGIAERAFEEKPTGVVESSLLKHFSSLLNNNGFAYLMKGETELAIQNYDKVKSISESIGDKEGLCNYYLSVGFIYNQQGNIEKALNYYHESLKLQEELGDQFELAKIYNNIALIYEQQKELDIALEYNLKSLAVSESIKDDRGRSLSLNNIGAYYQDIGNLDSALYYYDSSLVIRKRVGDYYYMAQSLNNIGAVHSRRGNYEEALNYYHQALDMQVEIEDLSGEAFSLENIGRVLIDMGNIKAAKKHVLRGYEIAQELGFPELIRDAAELLSVIYELENKGMQALEMHKLFITMRDSVNSEKTLSIAAKQEAKYEYEKQKVLDDAEHEKQAAIETAEHDKLLAVEQEEKEKQQVITYAIGGGLVLVIGFLFFVFTRLKTTRKQKNEIESAHFELEEKNQEIMDSIIYAKRIQSAILPPIKIVKENLPESFILYKPKDIVAGDFYWLEHVSNVITNEKKQSAEKEQFILNSSNLHNDVILFAAADCTGHGVPGAMVSVVCNNGLNRSVREHGLTEPGKILDKTREIVIQEFEKSEEEVKDGMDIALCSLSFLVPRSLLKGDETITEEKQGTDNQEQETVALLQYAGANNPLWIVRRVTSSARSEMESVSRSEHDLTGSRYELSSTRTDSQYEIIETKANKQPIGKFDKQVPYTTHTFELQKGDSIYIFSDGYVDQFGGDKGKKFKTKAFRELLLSVQDLSMEKQKVILDEAFESWRGDLEQIDDVCVIGVRV